MKIPFIAGNWKMYKTVADAVRYVKEFRALVESVDDVEIVIAPTFTALHAAAEAARNSNVGIAAQNLHFEAEGAFTGEISAAMAREAGADYVIIGHSERRTLFGETDASVNRKLAAALAAALTPIVCVGETLEQRERDETFAVLDRQLTAGLKGTTAEQLTKLVVAYEPVWAIGTGRNATPAQAGEAHGHIRAELTRAFGADAASHCNVIYGGSVKPGNIADLISQPDVDGALVGGASLDAGSFAEIVSRSRKAPV
jgi:triosephosphate isomerase (TIM)